MVGNFSAENNCSEKQKVLQDRSSKKPVRSEEQIMFKDKYPSILIILFGRLF